MNFKEKSRECPFCEHSEHIDEAADAHCVVCGCYPYPPELIDELAVDFPEKGSSFPKDDFNPWTHGINVVAHANMAKKETLLKAADDLEKEANNGYYDDSEGCILLLKIAEYFRNKAK